MKVLFILKERFYNTNINVKSYGLINSAKLVADALIEWGIQAKVVSVIDGNGIDKEVNDYKPDVVIIEALWVPSEKLKELIEIRRYRNICWIVRVHSNIGFLSSETYALKYINEYIDLNKTNLIISTNNKEFNNYLTKILNYNFEYLPNIIKVQPKKNINKNITNIMNVGCFGSLRILKNQVFQAICSMEAANRLNKILNFHITVDANINSNVQNSVLKNLEELFKNSKHILVKHEWKENGDFQALVREMDLGLQLSFTESFNIVTADFVNNGIPILVSDTIEWMPSILKTSTVNFKETTKAIISVYKKRYSSFLLNKMRKALEKYNYNAELIWIDFLKKL